MAPKEPVMAVPTLVLVHGGGMAADSWGLVVEEIHPLAPKLTVVVLDMPGPRTKPGDLREMLAGSPCSPDSHR
jgi:pimeloyl-ACP methyl ester carboxylesterase